MLDQKYLSKLICIKCGSHLVFNKKEFICAGRSCKTRFGIKSGIPVFLPTEVSFSKNIARSVWDREYKELFKKRIRFIDKYAKSDFSLIRQNVCLDKVESFLEIGCGRGRISAMISRLGIETVGLDISLEALMVARRIFEENDLRGNWVCGDIENIPFSNESFDLVFGGGVIEHVEDTQKVFNEIFRVLKTGGKLITTIPCLSVTTITQGLLIGSTPQVPLLREFYLFIHRSLFGGKFMKYGYEKVYSIKSIINMAKRSGFKKVFTQPYKVRYDFNFIPTKIMKGLASKLVQVKGFWPMIGLIAEKK